MKHSLEYCSLQYLNMWLEHDSRHHERLNGGTRKKKLETLKEAATYYKVARNLPTRCDEEIGLARYDPILQILDKVSASDFSDNPIAAITKVQEEISKAYSDRGVLSVTTKLLWLKVRSPIIIYDSQVRKALGAPDGNLSLFHKAWRAEYETIQKAIEKACEKLSRVSEYSYDHTIATPSYVNDISAQPWFQERVFDLCLWHKGR